MNFQFRIPKPMSEFIDLGFIPVVQMLARAEYFDERNACIPNPVQPDRSETMIHKQMCGKCVLHVFEVSNQRPYLRRGRRWRLAASRHLSRWRSPETAPTRADDPPN